MSAGDQLAAAGERLRGLSSRLGNAARGRGGLDDKLVLIGAIGGVLFVALVATLVLVEHRLSSVQDRLVRQALPAEQEVSRLEASVGAAFGRQAQVSSTVASEQLEPLRDRTAVEQPLRAAAVALVELHEAATLPAAADAFLAADAELFDAIERKHRLQHGFETELARIDGDLRALVEDSQAIAGLLRLEYMQVLRGIAGSLDTGVKLELVRTAVLGDVRAALDTTETLATSVLGLARATGQLGLAPSADAINSLAVNDLAVIRSRLARLTTALDGRLDRRPEVAARTAVLERRLDDIAPRILDEQRPDSLVALRRKVIAEAERTIAIRAASVAAAGALTRVTQALHAALTQQAEASVHDAAVATGTARLLTVIIVVIGAAGCAFAGRRLAGGIAELDRTNHRLTEMKLKLESFNASLEYKVAARTEALVARDRSMQRILDGMDEGLATVGLDGVLRGERSRAFTAWFGDPGERPLWEVLFPGDLARAAAYARGFEQIVDGALPFDVAVSLLPAELERGDRVFQLELRPVDEHGKLHAVIVVARDATAALAARRAEAVAREDRKLLATLADQLQRRLSHDDMLATLATSPRARGTGVPRNQVPKTQSGTMRIASVAASSLRPPARR
ncbi:MAG TPA: PAS domain-containing protein [Kofleriaceae bacterium]